MKWIKEKLLDIGYVFEEHPRVYRRAMSYLVLSLVLMFFYSYALDFCLNVQIMNIYVFREKLLEHTDLINFGYFIVPTLVLLWGYIDTVDLYEELERRQSYR